MKRHSIYLLVLFALVISACETIIEVDLPEHQPQLTVNSTFSPDSLWVINLSNSVGIGDAEDPEIVENGLVLVSANGAAPDTFSYIGNGFYLYPGATMGQGPVPGVNYTVAATAPGFTGVSASNLIPDPVNIQDVEVTKVNRTDYTETQVTVRFDDPAGKNYYFVALISTDTFPGSERFPLYLDNSDPALAAEPLYSNYSYQGLVFEDLSFEGKTTSITFVTFDDLDFGSHSFLLGTLSEDYFKYGRTYSSFFENQFNPFAEPVRIHSNVENGYGIFAGFSQDSWFIP